MNPNSDNIMLRIAYHDDLLSFVTYDRQHRRSARFVMLKKEAERAFLRAEYTVTVSRDLNNFLTVLTCGDVSVLRFTWLREARYGTLEGFNQNLDVPVGIIARVITTGESTKFLYCPGNRHTSVVMSGKIPKGILTDKLRRHALRKAMKNCFQWDGDKVTLYPDRGEDFYFTTKSGYPRNGGLVLHHTEVRTKAGIKAKFYYGIHT